MKQSPLRTRKAISSVIGTFFFIVIMVAAFSAILTAMSFQTQLVEQQANISDINVRKIQENFIITPYCIGSAPNETFHGRARRPARPPPPAPRPQERPVSRTAPRGPRRP